MASSSSSSCSFIFYALLIIQFCSAREIVDKGQNNNQKDENHINIYGKNDINDLDPALNVFFHVHDLYLGKKMPIYFAVNDPSTTPRLLTREKSDSIPFSSQKLAYLLELISLAEGSPQALAMEQTLKQCELEATPGETRFCASSLESMLDLTHGTLGMVKLKALTTNIHNMSNTNLQEYTFLNEPLEIDVNDMVACHTMAYPYTVYYCHGQKGYNRVFEISLGGENGNIVDAIAVCHMDTSQWDSDHVAFRVLGGQPGSSPVCHFLPADNIVWIPSP
ncbi:BURP domain-containing protein BNM2A-like [Bidens hawaiensis]|uniref:BURP domain-containing protein BNM2A-like n=1 Tax=Bidens hawaiensis TaxID=980011 RepID=UPI00404B7531